jgi:hypothetical protein
MSKRIIVHIQGDFDVIDLDFDNICSCCCAGDGDFRFPGGKILVGFKGNDDGWGFVYVEAHELVVSQKGGVSCYGEYPVLSFICYRWFCLGIISEVKDSLCVLEVIVGICGSDV